MSTHTNRKQVRRAIVETAEQLASLKPQWERRDDLKPIVAGVERQGLVAIGRGKHAEALLLEVQPHKVDDVALVVDDQDRLHRANDSVERGPSGRPT